MAEGLEWKMHMWKMVDRGKGISKGLSFERREKKEMTGEVKIQFCFFFLNWELLWLVKQEGIYRTEMVVDRRKVWCRQLMSGDRWGSREWFRFLSRRGKRPLLLCQREDTKWAVYFESRWETTFEQIPAWWLLFFMWWRRWCHDLILRRGWRARSLQ